MKLAIRSRCGLPVLLCAALAAQPIPEPAGQLMLDGDIAAPLTITAADLAAMPRLTMTLAEPGGSKTTYEGVWLLEVLKKGGLIFGQEMRGKALAAYLLAEAHDGYEVVFSLAELDPDIGGARVLLAESVRMVEKLHVVRLRK